MDKLAGKTALEADVNLSPNPTTLKLWHSGQFALGLWALLLPLHTGIGVACQHIRDDTGKHPGVLGTPWGPSGGFYYYCGSC